MIRSFRHRTKLTEAERKMSNMEFNHCIFFIIIPFAVSAFIAFRTTKKFGESAGEYSDLINNW